MGHRRTVALTAVSSSHSQRCREAYQDFPIVLGGIEASSHHMAHYDYWSDKVRRSILIDARADLLVYGKDERQVVEIAHRLAARQPIGKLSNILGTAFLRRQPMQGWLEIDASDIHHSVPLRRPPNPYQAEPSGCNVAESDAIARFQPRSRGDEKVVVCVPAFEQVRDDPVLYAHVSRVLHQKTNPFNGRTLAQAHGDTKVWINPPALPLMTWGMDGVYESRCSYRRVPHWRYGNIRISAFERIQYSVTILRGCFGGSTFCSITEHEEQTLQSRSEDPILREIETIRDNAPAFTGAISDLGGPTANMHRLGCRSCDIEANCRRPSGVYPRICKNLETDHPQLIRLYHRAHSLPRIKKVLIASGSRYDLAITSPEYVKELVTHHVGGYLKFAFEHTETGTLEKPAIGTYDRFKALFDRYSRKAGKEQYLIPHFTAAHPDTTDEDMLQPALWLKRNGFHSDSVQAFLPSPMAMATAMYHSERNSLRRITRTSEIVFIPKKNSQRRPHKAFLRYHDPQNWPLLREVLKRMGHADRIDNGKYHLVPVCSNRKRQVKLLGVHLASSRRRHSGLSIRGTGMQRRKILRPIPEVFEIQDTLGSSRL